MNNSSNSPNINTHGTMSIYEQLDKEELTKLVEEHMQSGEYETAAFWAEKLVALHPGKSVREKLPVLGSYLAMIITFVNRHDLFLIHLLFAYMYVNALYNREMFTEIINLPLGYLNRWDDVPFINTDCTSFICVKSNLIRDSETQKLLDTIVKDRKYESRLLFILAKTYLMVQNRSAAACCLKHCLSTNPYSSEAMHLAMESRLLKSSEIHNIFASVDTNNKFGSHVMKLLLSVHSINNDNSMKPDDPSSHSLNQLLDADLSMRAANAFRLYYNGCVSEAFKITSDIVYEFGYYDKCFLVHVACLVDLCKTSELYDLGHSLVRLQPEKEVTWYTVGCYYYSTGQYTTAKKFLNKCTMMNSGFGEGWLAYGHALFYAEEHEQAMNCYLRASRILEGHFEPLLYIAVEYCFANNFKFASNFLQDAETVAGSNAVVLHEQATVAFMKQDYTKAESIYRRAIKLITKCEDDFASISSMLNCEVSCFWEPVYSNLGHTLRKLEKFDDAIEVHRKSLLLSKNKSELYGSIGICYASIGDLDNAISTLNKGKFLATEQILLLNHFDAR